MILQGKRGTKEGKPRVENMEKAQELEGNGGMGGNYRLQVTKKLEEPLGLHGCSPDRIKPVN